MPITQSAKKALRQNVKRRTENLAKREAYKRAIKELRKLVTAKKMDEARNVLARVYQALDKAAKTNVIKKNKASRLKGRLDHMIAKSTRTSS